MSVKPIEKLALFISKDLSAETTVFMCVLDRQDGEQLFVLHTWKEQWFLSVYSLNQVQTQKGRPSFAMRVLNRQDRATVLSCLRLPRLANVSFRFWMAKTRLTVCLLFEPLRTTVCLPIKDLQLAEITVCLPVNVGHWARSKIGRKTAVSEVNFGVRATFNHDVSCYSLFSSFCKYVIFLIGCLVYAIHSVHDQVMIRVCFQRGIICIIL